MTDIISQDFPLLEYDPTIPALIEPVAYISPIEGIAGRCVLCFFQDVITSACDNGNARVIHYMGSEIGRVPVYQLAVEGQTVTVVHPGVGAPLAAGFLDELIALGCRKFIACGGSGVLDGEIGVGHLVVPTSAVRDEGTSYHYLPPSREVAPSAEGVAALEAVLGARGVPYTTGKTWTTDAIYRETPAKIALRKAEGCVTVEMEAAAFFAVAQFRSVVFAQLLYGGDDISGEEWDLRNWHRQASTREKVFWLAVEAALRL